MESLRKCRICGKNKFHWEMETADVIDDDVVWTCKECISKQK